MSAVVSAAVATIARHPSAAPERGFGRRARSCLPRIAVSRWRAARCEASERARSRFSCLGMRGRMLRADRPRQTKVPRWADRSAQGWRAARCEASERARSRFSCLGMRGRMLRADRPRQTKVPGWADRSAQGWRAARCEASERARSRFSCLGMRGRMLRADRPRQTKVPGWADRSAQGARAARCDARSRFSCLGMRGRMLRADNPRQTKGTRVRGPIGAGRARLRGDHRATGCNEQVRVPPRRARMKTHKPLRV
ncbi:hypothetical protein SAMN04489810_0251 [Microbacterium pygmaeum]|uniref:Uncharacterized protein n=1 Tax=Microbacterium pygmaeum TaxID=370764 RepID=A0A1G7U5U2_9MICO|nr:hypothetical protein SAMN04489810_0251 [Microbacterium pygmaeum]